MDITSYLNGIVIFLGHSKYFLLVIGTFFEGPIVMVSSGFLWHLGVFKFFPMFVALVVTNAVADTMWYTIGYFGARPVILKYGRLFRITPKVIDKVEKDFQKYDSRILILNKLTSGFGFVVLVLLFAGMTRVSYKKYALINLLGGVIFIFILVFVGNIFGNVYLIIPKYLKALFLILIISAIVYGFRKMKKYYLSTN